MGESNTHGYPGCLPQRKGDNRGSSFLERLLKTYKIEPSGFSSTKLLSELIKDTEDMYATHFGEHCILTPELWFTWERGTAHGDKKRALDSLRAGWKQKTRYFVTFRTGVYLGLAVPALAKGLYDSASLFLGIDCCSLKDHPGFQPSARNIPGWGGLLLVYATIFIPVFFSLLVTINILVWTKVRINHAFIFGE